MSIGESLLKMRIFRILCLRKNNDFGKEPHLWELIGGGISALGSIYPLALAVTRRAVAVGAMILLFLNLL